MLDPSCEEDLYCLHYVFIPRIQHQLDTFRETYSHHKLRTEGNMTPYQLWIQGMSVLNTDSAAVEGATEEFEYGIDWDGPCVISNVEHIVIEDVNCPMTAHQSSQLKALVDPLQTCGDFGSALYITAREYVRAC